MKPSKKYRRVSVGFWNDERVRAMSDNGKLLFLFLMTHPMTTPLGALRANVPGLAFERRWPVEVFEEAFSELTGPGMVRYDGEAGLMWLPNTIKHNPPESPNVVKSWLGGFNDLPECPLKTDILAHTAKMVRGFSDGFIAAFCEAFSDVLPEAIAKDFAGGCGKTTANQEQEQEQEQEQKEAEEHAPAGASSPAGDCAPPEPDPEDESPAQKQAAGPEIPGKATERPADEQQEGAEEDQEKALEGAKTAPCQYNAIARAFNELLSPPLPAVQEMTERRKRTLRARWVASSERQNLDWWRGYFAEVAASQFLTGQKNRFHASFDWLINPSNMVKVLEGNYRDDPKAGPSKGESRADRSRNTIAELMED